MTTPSDPDGTGSNEGAPYLPPARSPLPEQFAPPVPGTAIPAPAPAVATAPTLPSRSAMPTLHPSPAMRTRPAAAGAAMGASIDPAVQAATQRHRHGEPAYGSLPAATGETAGAARRLRAEAQRRRRRNSRIGWVATVVLLGGALTASWFVYRAFDDTAGTTADPVAPSSEVEVASDPDAPTTAPDATSASAADPPTWPGLGPSADEAEAAVADPGTGAVVQVAPPVPVVRPDYRTIRYDVRIYSGAEAGAPYRQFAATYDTVDDDYFGLFDDSASGQRNLISFRGDWRYAVGPDGVQRRVRRSKVSLQPEPDTPLAELLVETDVLPLSARPFATLVREQPGDPSAVAVDGMVGTVFEYRLDVDAFRAADPGGHAAWRALWSTALPDSTDLVVPGSEEVLLQEVAPIDVPRDRDPLDLGLLDMDASDGLTGVTFRVTDGGTVDVATIVSPEDDTRVAYVVSGYSDERSDLTFDENGVWVPAP